MNQISSITSEEDPFIPLFERWQRINAFLIQVMDVEKSHSSDSPHVSEAYETRRALELKMAETTPTSIEGLCGLLEVAFDLNGPDFLPGTDGWAEQMATLEVRILCQARASAQKLANAKA